LDNELIAMDGTEESFASSLQTNVWLLLKRGREGGSLFSIIVILCQYLIHFRRL